METYSVMGYWGYREEQHAECAAKVQETLSQLEQIHPELLGNWKETIESPDETPEKVPKTEEGLEELVREAEVDPAGGDYSFSMWNRSSEDVFVKLNVKCGIHFGELPLANSIILDLNLPIVGQSEERDEVVLDRRKLVKCVRAMASPWEWEWGTVITTELDRELDDLVDESFQPRVGWMTYLDDNRPAVPELPEVYEIDRDFAGGTLMVVDEEPLWASNDDDVERIREVQTQLQKAGVMRPIFADE